MARGKRKRAGGSGTGGAPSPPRSAAASASSANTAPVEAVVAAAPQKVKRGVAGDESVPSESFLQRVRKQVEFYFSDANLRRDAFFKRKMKEGDGYIELATILQFNRIRALRCFSTAQLAQAVRKSDMLALNENKTKVKRDYAKVPIEEVDPISRIIYIEGLPITFGVDDLHLHFSRYGRVRYVDLPRHRQTREARGFCFVEYASEAEAGQAAIAVNGSWPTVWPSRHDGKTLKAMSKKKWIEYKKEYQALQRKARGRGPGAEEFIGEEVATGATTSASEPSTSHGPRKPDLQHAEADINVEGKVAPAISSTAPAPVAQPRVRQGCLLRISGFPQPQTFVSVRHFVEHAVPVEYCDFTLGSSVAHVRLRSPEDCKFLLDDLDLTGRQLGWLKPEVSILSPEEEREYWQEASVRRAARDAVAAPPAPDTADAVGGSADKRRRRQLKKMVSNPAGVVIRGPSTTTTVYRFLQSRGGKSLTKKGGAGSSGISKPTIAHTEGTTRGPSASFVDTAAGAATFAQAGFGKKRDVRRRIFGMRGRSKKAGTSPALRATTVPMPRGLKNLSFAPATQVPRMQRQQVVVDEAKPALPPVKRLIEEPCVEGPPSKVRQVDIDPKASYEQSTCVEGPPSKVRQVELDPMLPPPSPGPLLAAAKAKKQPAPVRARELPDMMFPPPSPVAVQQDARKQKKSRSPPPVAQPVRKPAIGVAPLLLPPPSPIARRPEEHRQAAATLADSTAVATAWAPPASAASSATIASIPADPVPSPTATATTDPTGPRTSEVAERGDPGDSMLDKVDLDDLLGLME